MKKLISIIALFTVVSLNAYCEEIPAAIQALIKVMEESCLEMQDDKVSCGGVFAEGHDVVLCMLMDERHYDGMPLTEAVDVAGMTKEQMTASFKEEFVDHAPEQRKGLFALMVKYEYNLVMRLQGVPSGTKIDCRIDYKEFQQ